MNCFGHIIEIEEEFWAEIKMKQITIYFFQEMLKIEGDKLYRSLGGVIYSNICFYSFSNHLFSNSLIKNQIKESLLSGVD